MCGVCVFRIFLLFHVSQWQISSQTKTSVEEIIKKKKTKRNNADVKRGRSRRNGKKSTDKTETLYIYNVVYIIMIIYDTFGMSTDETKT